MADPISMAGGVVGLLAATVKVGLAINDLYRDISTANLRINGLQDTVQNFTSLMGMMKDTLENGEIQDSRGATGHVNNHWSHIETTIKEGQQALLRLKRLLEKINKNTTILDEMRKNIRLSNEAQEIGVYQAQIQQCNETLSLSFSIITVCNQSTLQQSHDKIMPKLDGLERKVQRLAFSITRSMSDLQAIIESNGSETPQKRDDLKERLKTLQKLKDCVGSASVIVSDVATSLNSDPDRSQSEYGDVFTPERSEPMRRYMAMKEDGDVRPPHHSRGTSTGVILDVVSEDDESDSETGQKVDEFKAGLKKGKRMLDEDKYAEAEARFMNCLKTIEEAKSNGALSHRQMVLFKPEIIRCLLRIYTREQRWEEAQSLLMEAIGSDPKLVVEMNSLAGALYENGLYDRALSCGSRALRAYNRTGQIGSSEEKQTLRLLIDICKAQRNRDKQMTYEDLLEERQTNPPPLNARSRKKSTTLSSDAGESSTATYRDIGEPMVEYGRKKPLDRLIPSSRDSEEASQRSISPTILAPFALTMNKVATDDPISPYSLATPDLTDRSSIATSMDLRNAQARGGYFDPEPQSSPFAGLSRGSASQRFTPSVFERELDEVFMNTAEKHTSFDSNTFPFVPKIVEAHDEGVTYEAFPVPLRSDRRTVQERRGDVLPIPPRSNLRYDRENRDAVPPLRLRNNIVSDLELDDKLAIRPATARESIISSDYESEKEAYIPNDEKDEEKFRIARSMTASTASGVNTERASTISSSKPSVPQAKSLYKKIVVVGESGCGKTPLITRFARDMYSEHMNRPTTWNTTSMNITVQGMRLDLVLWEIGGHDKEGVVRLRSSPKSNAILICFPINSPSALKLIPLLWWKDVKKYGKNAPYILVGLKSDLRSDQATIEALRRTGEDPVSVEQGQAMADQIQAVKYMECSSKSGEGIREVFDAVTQLTINSNDLVKAMKERDKSEAKTKKSHGDERKSSKGFIKDLLRRGTS